MTKKIHEKMLKILSHKGNANENHIKILPHTTQKGYHEEQKQQILARMHEKESLITIGGNVN
jgi:hypothetical protein